MGHNNIHEQLIEIKGSLAFDTATDARIRLTVSTGIASRYETYRFHSYTQRLSSVTTAATHQPAIYDNATATNVENKIVAAGSTTVVASDVELFPSVSWRGSLPRVEVDDANQAVYVWIDPGLDAGDATVHYQLKLIRMSGGVVGGNPTIVLS